MRRKYPLVVGSVYHIYNRGVAKCSICNGEKDRRRFLQGLYLFNDVESVSNVLWRLERSSSLLTMDVLRDYIKKQRAERKPLVRIMAYCIMGNHYHLLIEEIRDGGITKFMHKLGLGYALYFNNRHKRVGSLFQDKFKNVPVDDDRHLQYLLVYINVLNPAEFVEPHWKERGIRSIRKVLKYVENYPWSTHQEYINKRNSIIVEKGVLEEMLPTPRAYLELVKNVLEGREYRKIEHLALE